DRISAIGNRCSGHDLNASAGRERFRYGVARFYFCYAAQCRAWRCFRGAHGIAVPRGAMEGRILAIGLHLFGEDEAERIPYADACCCARTPGFRDLVDDGM